MVYCFSGTGNSQWVADKIQGLVADSNDVYGLFFPVYGWGIPKAVNEYILKHIEEIQKSEYVYAVMTCGDAKVERALIRVPEIADSISQRDKRTDVVRGACAWLKTYVLRPVFNRFLVTDKYFHVDNKKCTHCKRCIRGCPLGNMGMDDNGNVFWKHENCTGCLRCYHRCPNKAIQFGRFTKNKGQKIHDFD